MRRIVVLVDGRGSFGGEYFLAPIVEVWRQQGFEVVVSDGPERGVEGDLAILHVDLTVVGPEYLKFMRRFGRTINGRVADISKRRISQHLVSSPEEYDGPVIVKTNLNYGGQREREMLGLGSFLGRVAGAVRRRLHWSIGGEMGVSDYRIFDSPRLVPWAVWRNRDLVVERFLAERSGEFYCVRTWLFLGDRETHSLAYARRPVIKLADVVRREVLPEVPEALRSRRRELGFDYGKFDYAMVNDQVVLFDANRTPTLGNFPPEQYMPRVRHLAEGIEAFFSSPKPGEEAVNR